MCMGQLKTCLRGLYAQSNADPSMVLVFSDNVIFVGVCLYKVLVGSLLTVENSGGG